jgi:CRP/FNR family cyclic AMP-dependent transcriptional regulator
MANAKISRTNLLHFLQSTILFSGLADGTLERIAYHSRLRRLERGELLFNQSDPADAVYIVYSGCIALFLATPDGKELVINEMDPGDCFGELSLITHQPRSTSAMARETSSVIAIPSDRFIEMLKDEPELLQRILALTAQRLRMSSERESALAFLDSFARVARVLLLLAYQEGEEGVITITQEVLAQHAGLARPTVTKILSQWRSAGWIETERTKIIVLDRKALQQQLE